MTLALAEEALRVAQRVHPEVSYELRFLQAEAPAAGAWQLPGEPWAGRLEGCHKLFVLADEPPAQVAPALAQALKQLARGGIPIGGLSAGVYPLAQLGLLDGYRAAVHWRWQDDFTERFPKVIATSHLFDWDRDRLSACGGLAVLDLHERWPDQALQHYNFASPRLAAADFAAAYNGLGVPTFRLVNDSDLVPQIPAAVSGELLYQHLGQAVTFTASYAGVAANHSMTDCYLYALQHPQAPMRG